MPLFESDDFISTLPEETHSPRFLLVICKTKSLSIIEESEEISEESSLIVSESEEIMPEIKLGNGFESKTFSEQDFFESIESEYLDQSEQKDDSCNEISEIQSRENDNLESETQDKSSFEFFNKDSLKFRLAFEEINSKHQSLLQIYKIENERVQEYDKKFVQMIEINKEQMKRSQEREESLIDLITEKENELKVAQEEIFKLRSEKRCLETENLRIKDNQKNLLGQLSLCNPSPLLEELSFLKKRLKELENNPHSAKFQEYEENIAEKDAKIRELELQVHRFRPADNDTRDSQYSFSSYIDELDEAVRLNAKDLNLNESLVKDKEQMYLYGNRKLSLILNNVQVL